MRLYRASLSSLIVESGMGIETASKAMRAVAKSKPKATTADIEVLVHVEDLRRETVSRPPLTATAIRGAVFHLKRSEGLGILAGTESNARLELLAFDGLEGLQKKVVPLSGTMSGEQMAFAAD